MDGTFRTVPRLFHQLFTLLINVQGFVFPMMFVLMTRRSTELYTGVMRKLAERVPTVAPIEVMTDYEEASARAVRDVIGQGIDINGCWFHFAQSIVRKSRRLGLSLAYKNDAVSRRCIRTTCALSLLPPDAIQGAVQDIRTLAQ
jgi:MULE transposase domain